MKVQRARHDGRQVEPLDGDRSDPAFVYDHTVALLDERHQTTAAWRKPCFSNFWLAFRSKGRPG
jgi:hypothetical protein